MEVCGDMVEVLTGDQTHKYFFCYPTAFSGDQRAVPVHLRATALQGGLQRLSEPAGSWARAGTRRAGRPAEAAPARQA